MGQSGSDFENCVIIVGVGLIGGSIAAAVRQRFPKCSVIGVGRCEKRLQAAADAGLLTSWATDITEDLLTEPSVVVVCLPVNLIADCVRAVAAVASEGVLITDAGSVKAMVCDAVETCEKTKQLFVGSHPIAGSELGGFEHADPDLFAGRVCVITDCSAHKTGAAKLERARQFWQKIGCQILEMTAADHDRVLALTSHLPHIMAATTTTVCGPDNLLLTGSGFRDTTRIAAGDATLWKAILAGNRAQVVAAIRRAEQVLGEYREALEQKDDQQVEKLLANAAGYRISLNREAEQ